MPNLVLLRHGQSAWNLENRFTGWTDVDLSEQGQAEAHDAGRRMREAGLTFARAYTSVLRRAIRTLWIALDELDLMYVPQVTAWQLNERHYGALQGLNKAETAERHSAEQVRIWRRSYDIAPPPLASDDRRHPRFDPRYAGLQPEQLPAHESLKSTLERALPYWKREIAPFVRAGADVLVAAHGNSLRALAKHLFGLSDEAIPRLEIPTGNPLLIGLSPELRVQDARYLDAERAAPLNV